MRFVCISVLAGVVSLQSAFGQENLVPQRPAEISAMGRGEVTLAPDRATVLISVETRAPTASAAAASNSDKMTSVMQALRNAGVAQTDLVTYGYSVGQDPRQMRMGTPEPTARPEFLARNTVRVTVRRPTDTGRIIDAALNGGATMIASVQMASPNTDEARRNALAIAAAQALREAETLARAAGGSLGRLLSLSTGPGNPGFFPGDYAVEREMMMAGASGFAATGISPRELTISAVAFGRWEFIPGPRR